MNGKPPQDCTNCQIRHRAVCAYCEKSELMILESMKSYKHYAAGETILWTGDPMQHVGTVVTGVAALSQTMEDGRKQMVGLLLPSDFVGRPGRETSVFDIEATTDVTLCRFDRKPFEKLLVDLPHLRERMLEMALDELDAAREWMLLLGRKTAREKIASLLALVAERQKHLGLHDPARPIEFQLNLTREAMADYLGLTLETVSRQINALKKDRLIELERQRHVRVPELDDLRLAAGMDA